MGSLMSGWDSQVLMNPDTVKIERSRSLTKEEIDGFRKEHRKIDVQFDGSNGEDPMKPPLSPLGPSSKDSPVTQAMQTQSGNWNDVDKEGKASPMTPGSPAEDSKENKNDSWWTRSNWAFLNEPPEDDKSEKVDRYCAQFHVAKLATSTSI